MQCVSKRFLGDDATSDKLLEKIMTKNNDLKCRYIDNA